MAMPSEACLALTSFAREIFKSKNENDNTYTI